MQDAVSARLNDPTGQERGSDPDDPDEIEDPASALWRAVEALAAEQDPAGR